MSITATVSLFDDKYFYRLFHAFQACHDHWSHEGDEITFRRDADGKTLTINLAMGFISYGPEGDDIKRCWAENVDSGFMDRALTYFIYGTSRDDSLEGLPWMVRYGAVNEDRRPRNP